MYFRTVFGETKMKREEKSLKADCHGPSWGRTAWSSAVPGYCPGEGGRRIATGRAGARRSQGIAPGKAKGGLPRAELELGGPRVLPRGRRKAEGRRRIATGRAGGGPHGPRRSRGIATVKAKGGLPLVELGGGPHGPRPIRVGWVAWCHSPSVREIRLVSAPASHPRIPPPNDRLRRANRRPGSGRRLRPASARTGGCVRRSGCRRRARRPGRGGGR